LTGKNIVCFNEIMRNARVLTEKMEKFCQCLAENMSNADAYRVAYEAADMAVKPLYVASCRLAAQEKIKERVKELKTELSKLCIWTRGQSVKVLAKIANSANSTDANKIAAVRELNLMHGYNVTGDDDEDNVQPVTVTIQVKDAKRNSASK
jgi:hypothetical protein